MNSINQLNFVTEMNHVFFEVGSKFLNIIWMSFGLQEVFEQTLREKCNDKTSHVKRNHKLH
jgi:hypothetical protein